MYLINEYEYQEIYIAINQKNNSEKKIGTNDDGMFQGFSFFLPQSKSMSR